MSYRIGKRAKFTDLTIKDNIQYLKLDIVNGNDALSLWEEGKDVFTGPEIPAAIIQKFAKAHVTKYSARYEVMKAKGYKGVLRRVKENVQKLNDKSLVDTFYSIG